MNADDVIEIGARVIPPNQDAWQFMETAEQDQYRAEVRAILTALADAGYALVKTETLAEGAFCLPADDLLAQFRSSPDAALGAGEE